MNQEELVARVQELEQFAAVATSKLTELYACSVVGCTKRATMEARGEVHGYQIALGFRSCNEHTHVLREINTEMLRSISADTVRDIMAIQDFLRDED